MIDYGIRMKLVSAKKIHQFLVPVIKSVLLSLLHHDLESFHFLLIFLRPWKVGGNISIIHLNVIDSAFSSKDHNPTQILSCGGSCIQFKGAQKCSENGFGRDPDLGDHLKKYFDNNSLKVFTFR